jgi:hypothetical protein
MVLRQDQVPHLKLKEQSPKGSCESDDNRALVVPYSEDANFLVRS